MLHPGAEIHRLTDVCPDLRVRGPNPQGGRPSALTGSKLDAKRPEWLTKSKNSSAMWTMPGTPERSCVLRSSRTCRHNCRRPGRVSARWAARRHPSSTYSRTGARTKSGSRMIADSLDPAAEHGHGTSFQEVSLGTLPETNGGFGTLQPTATSPITAVTERQVPTRGRIDMTVALPLDGKSYCLAFENKPCAHGPWRAIERESGATEEDFPNALPAGLASPQTTASLTTPVFRSPTVSAGRDTSGTCPMQWGTGHSGTGSRPAAIAARRAECAGS